MKRVKGLIASVVVFSFVTTGCIGSFSAFNKLRVWNQHVTDQKWVNEVIFLALYIIPVYGLAAFADVIIFNSVEFWTGDNPMAKAKFSMNGEKQAVQTFSQDRNGKDMQILYFEKEDLKHIFSLHQDTGSSTWTGHVTWTDGRTEDFTIQAQDQAIRVNHTTAAGKTTSQIYSGDDLEKVRLRVARTSAGIRLAEAIP